MSHRELPLFRKLLQGRTEVNVRKANGMDEGKKGTNRKKDQGEKRQRDRKKGSTEPHINQTLVQMPTGAHLKDS